MKEIQSPQTNIFFVLFILQNYTKTLTCTNFSVFLFFLSAFHAPNGNPLYLYPFTINLLQKV